MECNARIDRKHKRCRKCYVKSLEAIGGLSTQFGDMSSAAQSARRLGQLKQEEGMAAQLQADGYTVYSPTVVCDRIAVKGDQVFFVEFKKRRQGLRPGQRAIQNRMPEHYLVIRHD